MDNEIEKESNQKPSVLWLIFRNEAEEKGLLVRVVEGIKLRIKEKLSEKKQDF